MQFTVVQDNPQNGTRKPIAKFLTLTDAEFFIKQKYANRWGLGVLSGITYEIVSS